MLVKSTIVTHHLGESVFSFEDGCKVIHTLVYRIDVHARLLILRKNSPLHGLILVCTFIDFEKIFPPARLFILHSSPILVCTFINFEKKFPPARSYFGLHVY